MKNERFSVTGMTCAACQANITKRVQKIAGVSKVDVSLLANRMTVEYDDAKMTAAEIAAAVTEIGYGASPMDNMQKKSGGFRSEWQQRMEAAASERAQMKKRLISSIALLIPLMYLAMGHMLGLPLPAFLSGPDSALVSAFTQFLIALIIAYLNRHFYTSGFQALSKRVPNMDSLVALGSSASFLYGLFVLYRMMAFLQIGDTVTTAQYAHELYFESAAMILTLVTVGKYLESRSKAKTSEALDHLIDLAPKTAVVIRDGMEHTIPAEEVLTGDTVVIRPGERIPVDGVVTAGNGYVDEAAVTGESLPVEKQPGDRIISATLNKNGSFQLKATGVGDDTTLAKIIRLVDEAGSTKAPIARLADRVSGVFVPMVMGIALITAVVWLMLGADFEFAFRSAITVLVISCPCALGLATPVAIMVGTGKAAESGILIKSAASLEELHLVTTVVLDKTGTITEGHPAVTDVAPADPALSEAEFLSLAAALESGSEHPLGEAVVRTAKEKALSLPNAEQFTAIPGRGVSAEIGGKLLFGGNIEFLKERAALPEETLKNAAKIAERFAENGRTPLLFAERGSFLGVIAVADPIKPTSRTAIERMRALGLEVIMLTGDNRVTAEAIRAELGLEKAISGVLPDGKEQEIRALQEQGRIVSMVGDGINDAPALMRANVGIAIGAGADIAIDSADVVLMKSSLPDVVTAIELSRKVVQNIRMNLFWAFFYNILGIPVAAGVFYPAFGLKLSPMIGSAAMSLSSVCVVLNALRLRFFQPQEGADPKQVIRKEEQTMEKVFNVEGMMCKHCVMHVEKALAAVVGVESVTVILEKGTAAVTLKSDVADEVLIKAIADAGYTAKRA